MTYDIETIMAKAYKYGFEYEKGFHGCAQCAVGALYEAFPEFSVGYHLPLLKNLISAIGVLDCHK